MPTQDMLLRFIFDQLPVRGSIIRMDSTFADMLEHQALPLPVRRLLGEMAAGATLLTAGLKFEGSVLLQVQGDGPVRLAIVEVHNDLTLRATAKLNDGAIVTDTMTTKDLINANGNGRCALMLDPKDRREGEALYQGVVPLSGNSIAEALMSYMQQSEQLTTRLWLAADAEHVSGMMLQKMPDFGGKDQDLIDDPQAWERIGMLAETITNDELLGLNAQEIQHRLFWQEKVRNLAADEPRFECSCSKERIEHAILNLGEVDALQAAHEQNGLEVTCNFCGKTYRFTPAQVAALFSKKDSVIN